MSSFRYISSKDASAVEDLLSQAKDLYVLEQVAAINLAGFTDSSLPTNLETRFRRLKSLPVSRQPDPVSSSKKLLSHSKSVAEKRRIQRVPSLRSRPSVSRDGNVLSPPTTKTQAVKLLSKGKPRTSSASSASIDLVSPSSSEPDQKERSNRKPKSKLSLSWFDKLVPSRAMGCLFASKHNIT